MTLLGLQASFLFKTSSLELNTVELLKAFWKESAEPTFIPAQESQAEICIQDFWIQIRQALCLHPELAEAILALLEVKTFLLLASTSSEAYAEASLVMHHHLPYLRLKINTLYLLMSFHPKEAFKRLLMAENLLQLLQKSDCII